MNTTPCFREVSRKAPQRTFAPGAALGCPPQTIPWSLHKLTKVPEDRIQQVQILHVAETGWLPDRVPGVCISVQLALASSYGHW